jgi:Solute-binding protein AdeT 1/2
VSYRSYLLPSLLCLLLALFNVSAKADQATNAGNADLIPLTMCVFDFIGHEGPVVKEMQEFKLEAFRWGVNLSFLVYTDDRVASEEFKNGVCDMLNLPGIRAREYNDFTGSINAVGALPTYDHLGMVIKSLSSPRAAELMRKGDYEIIGIGPIGAIFLFVNDKGIKTPSDMAGKKVTVLDNAPETEYLAKRIGMTPVSSSIMNALQKFNNKAVDITGAPGLAYEPMEMYKGLEPNGGIIRWPTLQITMQIMVRWDKVPDEFGQKSRTYFANQYLADIKKIEESENTIPDKYWIDISEEEKNTWNETFRESRIALREQKVYNAKALTLFRKVRCKVDSSLAECTSKDKE